MDIERQKNFILQVVFWLIVAGIVYGVLKYVMPIMTPFIIGFLVALILRPLTKWIAKAARLNQKVVALVFLLLFYGLTGSLLALSGIKMVNLISGFVSMIPEYYLSTIEPALGQLLNNITILLQDLDPSLRATIQGEAGNIFSSLASLVTSFSSSVLNWLTGFAGALPIFLISFVIAILVSFFVSADYSLIKAFIVRQLKPEQIRVMRMIRDNFKKVVGNYLKAYLFLMTLTFTEISIGLWLIGIQNAALIALGIAVFDIIPVLGAGGILIPWIVIDLLVGDVGQAIKILILYAVVTVVRQYLEPKVVGSQIGLHPLVTLLCMYVGAYLFGAVGLLGLPVTVTILKKLNENGTISLFKA